VDIRVMEKAMQNHVMPAFKCIDYGYGTWSAAYVQ